VPPKHPHFKLGVAWLALCCALAVHVADEALTGFLSIYNPTVTELRRQWPGFPMPPFAFGDWLAGLAIIIVVLTALSFFVFRGDRWIRPAAYFLSVFMMLNGVGHTLGTIFGRTVASVQFPRPMPGFWSSPLLIAAAVWLFVQLGRTRPR
jgi:hypothetical protein